MNNTGKTATKRRAKKGSINKAVWGYEMNVRTYAPSDEHDFDLSCTHLSQNKGVQEKCSCISSSSFLKAQTDIVKEPERFLQSGLTFQSIWQLFKCAGKNSRWNASSLDSIRRKWKWLLHIHDHIHISIRYLPRCQRGRSWFESIYLSVEIHRWFLWDPELAMVLQEVNESMTRAGRRLDGAKGQSNQFHLAKRKVRGFVC